MGYYRNYYGGRMDDMAVVRNTGGCGQESILVDDVISGENTIVMEDSVMVMNNTDTLTGCKCDSCEECGCDPDICRCNCHTDRDLDMFKMENID
jgi:hypothetical protein